MTTLDHIRADGEAAILLLLAQLDERHKLILRDAIRRYGRVQNIPESVWQHIQEDIPGGTVKDKHGDDTTVAAAILLLLTHADDWTGEQMAAQGAPRQQLSPRHLTDYSLEAARQTTASAAQTTTTLRTRLARKIEDEALSPNGGVGVATDFGIDAAIDEVLTAARRATIATDLTTGALTAGEIGAAARVTGDDGTVTRIDGVKTTISLIWRTERDFLVCPRCSPLEGQPEEVWSLIFPEGPGDDAHPNCRCYLDIRVVPVGGGE